MKKILTLILLLFAYYTQAQSGYAVVSATDVNFRTQPDTKAELISKVQLGTLAKVLTEPTESKNWYKLQIGSKTGWISADYVFDLIPLDSIPGVDIWNTNYIPFIAVSRISDEMGRRDNFLLLAEGKTLNVNSMVYPVKFMSQSKENYIVTYRNNFLSLTNALEEVKLAFYHEISDGTITMAISYEYIILELLVFEFKPKLSEGIFEAKLKFYYNEIWDK